MYKMIIPYNPNLRSAAKQLRDNPTATEIMLWNILKLTFPKLKFLRQVPMDNFIVDIFCKEKLLIIEVDGEVHDKQKERDAERDNILLMKYNLRTLRIKNSELTTEKENLLEKLNEALYYLPLLKGGRGEC